MFANDALTISLLGLAAVRMAATMVFCDFYYRRREPKYLVLIAGWGLLAAGPIFGIESFSITNPAFDMQIFMICASLGTLLMLAGALLYFIQISNRMLMLFSLLIPVLIILVLNLLPAFFSNVFSSLIQAMTLFITIGVVVFRRNIILRKARNSYFWLLSIAVFGALYIIVFIFYLHPRGYQALAFFGTTVSAVLALIFFLHLEYNIAMHGLEDREQRYRFLFDSAAVSLWEEDASALQKEFERLRKSGVTDLRQYLEDHPEFLMIAVGMIKILNVNDESVRLHDAPGRKELIQSLDRILLPASLVTLAEQLEALFDGKHRFVADTMVQTLSGIRRDVILSTTFPLADAEPGIALVSLTDITEQKRAEQELRRISRMYSVLSQINQMIIRVSSEDELLREICGICVGYGSFKTAWIGTTVNGLRSTPILAHAADDISGKECEIFRTVAYGNDWNVVAAELDHENCFFSNDLQHDLRLPQWKDSACKLGYGSYGAFPIKKCGVMTGVLNLYSTETDFWQKEEIQLGQEIVGDICLAIERLDMENQFHQSEERYHSIFENANDSIIIMNATTMVFQDVNAKAEEMFGYSKTELLALSSLDVSPEFQPDGSSSLEKSSELPQAAMQGTTQFFDWQYKRANGSVFDAQVSLGVLGNEDQKLIFAIIRDVSERKKLEDRLRQVQKMESIGQLAGGIAHDFNNILSAIVGYGHLLLMKLDQNDPQRLYAEQILSASERAALLTRGLLAFSRKQILDTHFVDINDVVRDIEKLLRRMVGEHIEFQVRCLKEPLTVNADSGQIGQVLMNLAMNAGDAMAKAGRLTIETSITKMSTVFQVAHGYGTPGSYALLTVSDTGTGIEGGIQGRIFEPFFTTKEIGQGTGLGLSIAYGIVKQHNGFIDCYSEPGNGTIFKIYLPLVNQLPLPIPNAPVDDLQGMPRGTETILLAEDDEVLRGFVETLLSGFGYTVISAVNGEEAVEQFRSHADEIQLIMLDVIMPKLNGKDAHEVIVKIRPGMKTIFMSGYTADVIHKRGFRDNGLDFLMKPIFPMDLLKKVREVLDRR